MCQLKKLSRHTKGAQGTAKKVSQPPALDPTPTQRKQRARKQVRREAFERWIAGLKTATQRVPEEGEEGAKDKTDWWRVETTRNQGGVCYPTSDAFLIALRDAFIQHKGRMARIGRGAAGVLQCYGSYSIVEQPEILEVARKERVQKRMEEIGFR